MSMATIRAWAWGDRTKAACRSRGMTTSSVYVPRPATSRAVWGRITERPMYLPSSRAAGALARPRRRARDRRHDGVIAGAAAVVAAERLADRRRGRDAARVRAARARSRACPACRSRTGAHSPLRNACCRWAMAPLSARPSIVSTRQPSAWAASIRHPRTGLSSTRTVHAPQTPCSQPTCEPVSPSS